MDEENELIALRRQKLETLRTRGVAPFGQSFETSGSIEDVRAKFAEGTKLRAAGRITAHRDMGKSHFLDLRDATGRIQIYVQAKELGPEAIGAWIRHHGWTMYVDPAAGLVWPVHPFNPYANAPEEGLAHAVAALSVPIRLQAKPGHPVRPNEQEIKFRLATE